MKYKDTHKTMSAMPPEKVKPPKITPLPQSDGSEQTTVSEEAPLNSEITEDPKNNDQVIAPDGSPDPKQDQTPLC